MAIVYHVKVWDIKSGDYVFLKHKRTYEGIKAINGVIDDRPKEVVPDDAIDGQWRYIEKDR